MKKVILATLVAMTMTATVQAKSSQVKPVVFNTFICMSKDHTNKITLYENKTAKVKWANSMKEKGTYKAQWVKKGNEIEVKGKTDMPDSGGWYTYGILTLDKQGGITFYNPEYNGDDSPKCRMK